MLSTVSKAEAQLPPLQPEPRTSTASDFVIRSVCSSLFSFFSSKKTLLRCLCSCRARIHIKACIYIPPGKGNCISTFCKTLSKAALAAGNGFSSHQIASPLCAFPAMLAPGEGSWGIPGGSLHARVAVRAGTASCWAQPRPLCPVPGWCSCSKQPPLVLAVPAGIFMSQSAVVSGSAIG